MSRLILVQHVGRAVDGFQPRIARADAQAAATAADATGLWCIGGGLVALGVIKFIETEFSLSKIQLGWSVSSLTLTATLAMMVSVPRAMRGAQAAASPSFGAPAAPVP